MFVKTEVKVKIFKVYSNSILKIIHSFHVVMLYVYEALV
jgi:hypothetical protein